MSFGYILNKVAAEKGWNISDSSYRILLTDKINEAARELYRYEDLPVSLKEVFIRTSSNVELALPPFVGELRAIRQGCKDFCSDRWVLHDLVPRYNQQEWTNLWKKWRIKSYVAVAAEFNNTAAGTIVYPVVDDELIITFVGDTANSNRAIDNITMDAATKPWTKTFNNIARIAKNKVTDYDVIIKDADSNEIAIIYADQLESRYLLVDVSQFPTTINCSCGDGTYIMEILYKPILPKLSNDEDFFPVDGFDDILVNWTLELLTKKEEGKEQRAFLGREEVKILINEITQDKVGATVRKITFKRNPFMATGLREHYTFYPYRRRF